MSAKAKRVSIHNNYFTFPVIALMVSNHFPTLYSSRFNWLALLVIVGGGAAARHFLNIRWTYRSWGVGLGATIFATVALTWMIVGFRTNRDLAAAAPTGPVDIADVRHVIDRRCAVCHSDRPTDMTFGRAPGGVMFDTEAQIELHAARIRERAFITRTMPPANKTGITESERALIAAWAARGEKR
jgi:uncharacterized membrane protein